VRSPGRKEGARKVREGGRRGVGSEQTKELAEESAKGRRSTLPSNGLVTSERMDLGLVKGVVRPERIASLRARQALE
jgi:hypothetical protein